MNKAQMDELKQFIRSTVQQSEAKLREEMSHGLAAVHTEMQRGLTTLRQEMREGFAGAAETLDELHSYIHQRDVEVEKRLGRLEQHLI